MENNVTNKKKKTALEISNEIGFSFPKETFLDGVTVTMVSCESRDWSGLYVNEFLEYEGHQFYEEDFIGLIRKYKVFKEVNCFEITDEYMDLLGGSFPYKLEDVKCKG